MNTSRIAIIGAGIAGLAAASALGRFGVEAEVFEKSPARPASGGALWLFPNAIVPLAALGLEGHVTQLGTVVGSWEVRSWSERLLSRLPIDELSEESRLPLIFIERSRLLRILGSALPAGLPHRGWTCAGFSQLRNGIRPLLRRSALEPEYLDGESFDGLIGADGFHSVIRRQLVGPEAPRCARQVGWVGRAAVAPGDWPFEPGTTVTFLGGGLVFHGGTFRTDRGGSGVTWYAIEKGLYAGRQIDRQQLIDLYADRHPGVASVIERSPDPVSFPVRDRRPLPRWGRGAVTLLGDAAHPVTPNLGQGACLAIEGAVSLARLVGRHRDPSAAFRAYERERLAQTAHIMDFSRMMTVLSAAQFPGMDVLRELSFRLWWPRMLMNEYRWIVSRDPR